MQQNFCVTDPEFPYWQWCGSKFRKSTHFSMISNSVAHLQSYTNADIAGNSAPISPGTPRGCGYCRTEL